MIYVGMDLHQKTTTWFAVDEAGERVSGGVVTSNEPGWREAVGNWPAAEVRVALETGTMTWWAVSALRELGIEPTVVDARRFKLIAQSRKKSDRRDARTLAEALRAGLAEQCTVVVPSERARRGRALLQARQTIVRQGTISRNAIKGLLRSVGVMAPHAVWSKRERFDDMLRHPAIPAWLQTLLCSHYAIWVATQRQRAVLDDQIKDELAYWPDAMHLQELPGFGPLVTLAVASAIDSPKRFARGRQAASYSGLVPTVRDSGESARRGGITHEGRSLVRHALVQAAHSALRSRALSPSLRAWAYRLSARRGRQIAVAALGRKLMVLSHHMMSTGVVYDRSYGAIAKAA
jgi:transposase